MALVSVVVPVYNIEKYIDKCVDSIRNQTYKKLEIILVDDGSTDNSGVICDEHAKKDARIQVIHKENGGLSDARNKGISKATGEYIAFVDGDDYISLDYMETCVNEALKRSADLLIFDYQEIEEETNRREIWSMNVDRSKVMSLKSYKKLLFTTPSACNKFYKRSFFAGGNISFPVGRTFEDLATIPKILEQAKRVVYLDSKPLYFYNLRQGSIMRSNQFAKSYENRTKAFDDLKNYFAKKAPGQYHLELEFLCFLHCYFIPSKEIVYNQGDEQYLERFKAYAMGRYPQMLKNVYIKTELSKKDRILLSCLKRKNYKLMNAFSAMRMYMDKKRRGFKNE